MIHDFDKCLKNVRGCRTLPQMITAVKMCNLFLTKWKKGKRLTNNSLIYFNDLLLAQKKRLHVLKEYGQTLEGAECLVVSNEDIPVWKGKVVYFEDWGKPIQLPLPIIASEEEGDKKYLCMGVVLPYNEGSQIMLNEMPYKERWNFVCRPHAKFED